MTIEQQAREAVARIRIARKHGSTEYMTGTEADLLDAFIAKVGEPTKGDWVNAKDVNRLVREMDVALNGVDGAAPQASLCDIAAQMKRLARTAQAPLTELFGNFGQLPIYQYRYRSEFAWRDVSKADFGRYLGYGECLTRVLYTQPPTPAPARALTTPECNRDCDCVGECKAGLESKPAVSSSWTVSIIPVAVKDAPDAHRVEMFRGVQIFHVGMSYWDTKEEAEWYAEQLRFALADHANQYALEALKIAQKHLDMDALKISHCNDAAKIESALGVKS